MSEAGAAGAAFDAIVYADGTPAGDDLMLRKARSAVAYFERAHAAALDAISRAEAKAEKFKNHAMDAVEAIDAARVAEQAAADQLASAERQLQSLEG